MAEAPPLFPEVRIKSSWLLSEWALSRPSKDSSKSRQSLAAIHDHTDEAVELYRQPWEQRSGPILQAICQFLNLRFRQGIIDVYVVPGFDIVSDPIIIGSHFEPDFFPDLLTHELFHTLLTDNMTYKNDPVILERWKDMFGDTHSFQTLVHIPVHAGMQAVYTDVLEEPYRLQRDIAFGSARSGYAEAWQYVERHGYQHILGQLAATHQMLARAEIEIEPQQF